MDQIQRSQDDAVTTFSPMISDFLCVDTLTTFSSMITDFLYGKGVSEQVLSEYIANALRLTNVTSHEVFVPCR